MPHKAYRFLSIPRNPKALLNLKNKIKRYFPISVFAKYLCDSSNRHVSAMRINRFYYSFHHLEFSQSFPKANPIWSSFVHSFPFSSLWFFSVLTPMLARVYLILQASILFPKFSLVTTNVLHSNLTRWRLSSKEPALTDLIFCLLFHHFCGATDMHILRNTTQLIKMLNYSFTTGLPYLF